MSPKADAMSSARRISTVATSKPSVRAAASMSRISCTLPELSGLATIANRRRPGMTSRKGANRFSAVSVCWSDRPVTLPPGRARLAMRPSPSGSFAVANTLGISDVALFGCGDCDVSVRNNHVHLTAGKLGRNFADAVGASLSPAIFDDHTLAVAPAELAESLYECRNQRPDRRGRGSAKETDSRQVPRLLRTRRKRTRDYRAPQQGDELAPPNARHGDFLPCRVKTFGLPRTQPAAERAATPWARPESF